EARLDAVHPCRMAARVAEPWPLGQLRAVVRQLQDTLRGLRREAQVAQLDSPLLQIDVVPQAVARDGHLYERHATRIVRRYAQIGKRDAVGLPLGRHLMV